MNNYSILGLHKNQQDAYEKHQVNTANRNQAVKHLKKSNNALDKSIQNGEELGSPLTAEVASKNFVVIKEIKEAKIDELKNSSNLFSRLNLWLFDHNFPVGKLRAIDKLFNQYQSKVEQVNINKLENAHLYNGDITSEEDQENLVRELQELVLKTNDPILVLVPFLPNSKNLQYFLAKKNVTGEPEISRGLVSYNDVAAEAVGEDQPPLFTILDINIEGSNIADIATERQAVEVEGLKAAIFNGKLEREEGEELEHDVPNILTLDEARLINEALAPELLDELTDYGLYHDLSLEDQKNLKREMSELSQQSPQTPIVALFKAKNHTIFYLRAQDGTFKRENVGFLGLDDDHQPIFKVGNQNAVGFDGLKNMIGFESKELEEDQRVFTLYEARAELAG